MTNSTTPTMDQAMRAIERLGDVGLSCLIQRDGEQWRVVVDTGWLSRHRIAEASAPQLEAAMLAAAESAELALACRRMVDQADGAKLARLFEIVNGAAEARTSGEE